MGRGGGRRRKREREMFFEKKRESFFLESFCFLSERACYVFHKLNANRKERRKERRKRKREREREQERPATAAWCYFISVSERNQFSFVFFQFQN